VKLIAFDRNLGFARAYNRAVEHVHEDTVVFLNNDVEVDKDWLTRLIEPMRSMLAEHLAICGSKLLLFFDRTRVNHAGGALLPVGGGIDIDFLRIDEAGSARSRFVGSVSGASMAMKRSIFLELGGFDEDFFSYFEDTDLCWRAWLAGYRVLLVPESRIYHKLGASWGSYLNPERLYLGERNRLQCLLKNLEVHNVFLGIFVSFSYSVLRTIRFLRLGDARPVFASLRAHWWQLRNIQKIAAKRRWVQRHRLVPDSFLLRHGLMTSYLAGLREFMRMTSDRGKYADRFSAGRARIEKSSFSEGQ
jgi:GT2 family glycosyltransferase